MGILLGCLFDFARASMSPDIPLSVPYGPEELYGGEANRFGLAIYPQEYGRFVAVDVHSSDDAVSPRPRQDEFMTADMSPWTAASPALLEALKAISLVAFLMLLPCWILVPQTVGLGEVAGLDCLQKTVHMMLFRPIPEPPGAKGA